MHISFSCCVIIAMFLTACSAGKQIERSAKKDLLKTPVLASAHVGISLYETGSAKWLFNYQGDKYFVPASNTKLPSCYAAMKYLGDSVASIRYQIKGDTIFVQPLGDPSFLQEEFTTQPLLQQLKSVKASVICWTAEHFKTDPLGSGWAWSDYDQTYMAERSVFPMHSNTTTINSLVESFPPVTIEVPGNITLSGKYRVERDLGSNHFAAVAARDSFKGQTIPFHSDPVFITEALMKVTGKQSILLDHLVFDPQLPVQTLYSLPLDKILEPMMHRSDNFYAEQCLMMVSQKMFGFMNEHRAIDSLLKTSLADLPQAPRWADGSGLSRYNLFSPQDFVTILLKMKNEFGMERIKKILPTGGEGTISSYYKDDKGYFFAKTGTLSGVVALSGIFYTKKGKEIAFSVLVNNHNGSATDVRRAVERFISRIRQDY